MVFGNIRDLKDYGYLEEDVLKCFEYAKNHDLLAYETGSHEIDGDNLFVNIVEYETTTPENRFWEAHRQYLDLHFMLRGPEQIDVNFIDNMEQKDAHRTAVQVEKPVKIKKAIFKIKIQK